MAFRIGKGVQEGMEEVDIPELEIPEFSPHIKEEDIDGLETLSPFEKQMLLQGSLIGQQLDFVLHKLVDFNKTMRGMRAEQIKRGKQLDSIVAWHRPLKWAAVVLITGGLLFVGGWVFQWMFHLE